MPWQKVVYALARPFILRQAQYERRKALLMRFDRLPSTGSGQPGRTDWEGYLCFGRLARPFMLRQAQHERREALLMCFDRFGADGDTRR
ncbi:MAG: hypothetical protein LBD67_06965 [Candidatus Accumulibacter sp.]|jgi:hypothetical protein|nr:hypothetical protein [Accumulibacter sp.]